MAGPLSWMHISRNLGPLLIEAVGIGKFQKPQVSKGGVTVLPKTTMKSVKSIAIKMG